MLMRAKDSRDRCLFVTLPDVVANARATEALYREWEEAVDFAPRAYVLQDGAEGFPSTAAAVFLGGTTAFKESQEALQLVHAAVASKIHVHVGRVTYPERYFKFRAAGAHTCDGSGLVRFTYRNHLANLAHATNPSRRKL
jgi:hypothetical protein